jgi:hypothetical protein
MDFIHGIAECKNTEIVFADDSLEHIEAGEKGIITGYLPKLNRFSVYFILGR